MAMSAGSRGGGEPALVPTAASREEWSDLVTLLSEMQAINQLGRLQACAFPPSPQQQRVTVPAPTPASRYATRHSGETLHDKPL